MTSILSNKSERERLRVIQVAHWARSGLTAVMRDIGRAMLPEVEFTFVELGASDTSDYYDGLGEHLAFGLQRDPVAAIRAFRNYLRAADPDIIHVHSLQPLLWTSLLEGRSTPIVSTVHNEYPFLRGHALRDRTKRALQGFALARAQPHVVAVADGVAAMLKAHGLTGQRLWTIENAISPLPREKLPEIRQTMRASLGIDDEEILVVSAGRLHPQKGFDLLIDAFARIVPQHKGARLIIAGEGEQRRQLEDTIQSLGLADRVRLPGHVSPLLEFLAAADLFVLSSRFEGCPLALAEAMSCEVPVVATPVATAPGILADRHDSLLASDVSATALATAMSQALSSTLDRNRVGKELADLVRRRYTLDVFGARYREVYDAALRGQLR